MLLKQDIRRDRLIVGTAIVRPLEKGSWKMQVPRTIFLILCFLVGFFGSETFQRTFMDNRIPDVSQVQEGYIVPNDIEIKCEDLDGNDQQETIIVIGGKPYLLMEVDREPVISAYEINVTKEISNSTEGKGKER